MLAGCSHRNVFTKITRYVDFDPSHTADFVSPHLNDRNMARSALDATKVMPVDQNPLYKEMAENLRIAANMASNTVVRGKDSTSSWIVKSHQPQSGKEFESANTSSPGFSKYTRMRDAAAGAGAGADAPKPRKANKKEELAEQAALIRQQRQVVASMIPKVTADNMNEKEQKRMADNYARLSQMFEAEEEKTRMEEIDRLTEIQFKKDMKQRKLLAEAARAAAEAESQNEEREERSPPPPPPPPPGGGEMEGMSDDSPLNQSFDNLSDEDQEQVLGSPGTPPQATQNGAGQGKVEPMVVPLYISTVPLRSRKLKSQHKITTIKSQHKITIKSHKKDPVTHEIV